MTTADLDKLALKLVALDRQLAGACRSALRAWAKTKKATGRTYSALAFAASIETALEQTKVKRGQ
jgi:hypothetical protein